MQFFPAQMRGVRVIGIVAASLHKRAENHILSPLLFFSCSRQISLLVPAAFQAFFRTPSVPANLMYHHKRFLFVITLLPAIYLTQKLRHKKTGALIRRIFFYSFFSLTVKTSSHLFRKVQPF
jgi:hypothetical protein